MRSAILLLLAAAATAGCRPVGLQGEIEEVRSDIRALEKRIHPETPIYIDEFESALDDETPSIPGEIYEHVARHLSRMTDEEVRSRVDKNAGYRLLVDEPSAMRGRFVRMEGVIGKIWTEQVRIAGVPNPWIYAGIVFVKNRDPLLFHVIEKPDLMNLKADLVYLDAIFLKVIEYEIKDGGRVRAPLVVGRRLHKYH
jgi:hypothetical protein